MCCSAHHAAEGGHCVADLEVRIAGVRAAGRQGLWLRPQNACSQHAVAQVGWYARAEQKGDGHKVPQQVDTC